MPIAYSYIRFSTGDQMKGDSCRRQTAMAAAYAAKHGLTLDDKLKMSDLGVSAYRGRNIAEGALGVFLDLARAGDIPTGSYLLVEALDRISRQTARHAMRTLENIVDAGIAVVTLDNEKVYSSESLDRDPMDLMLSLLLFARANEESATKARRLKAAWQAKRASAGSKPMTAKCPGWLRLRGDRSGYEVLGDRAMVIQDIFGWTLDGMGQHAIAAKLNKDGVKPFGRGDLWQRSYVKKLLSNPSVVGDFVPHTLDVVEGRKVRTATEAVRNYFPAIIDRENFERVATMATNRARQPDAGRTQRTQNILGGLARCPKCGKAMTRVMKGNSSKPYLVCTVAKQGGDCDYRQVRLEMVERTMVGFGSWIFSVVPSPDTSLEDRYRDLEQQRQEVEETIQNLVRALARGGTSKALSDALRDNEVTLDQIGRDIQQVSERRAGTMTNRLDNVVDEYVKETSATPVDLGKANAILRQLFEAATVDYRDGVVRMKWKGFPEAVEVDVRYTVV